MANRTPVLQLRGTTQLVERLRKVAGRVVAEDTLLEAVEGGAEKIAKRAATMAPVGTEEVQRRRLREGIVHRRLTGRDRRRYGDGYKVTILREVAHGIIMEFGAPAKNIPAQPFMRPAFDGLKGGVIRDVKRALIKTIREAERGA